MNKVFLLCAFLAMLLSFNSCEDTLEDFSIENTTIKSEHDTDEIQLSIIPEFNDGRATFTDFEEYTQFYQELESLSHERDQSLGDYMYDLVPYTSIFKRTMDDEFEHIEDRYNPILADHIMAYILNLDHEFQIGSRILVYATNEDIITFEADDMETQMAVRNMPKGASFSIQEVPSTANWNRISDGGEQIMAASLFCSCDVIIETIDCCSASITGRCRSLFGEGDGTVTIRVTPGTNTDNVLWEESHDIEDNFSFVLNDLCNVPFDQFSSLQIEAKVNSDCLFNLGSASDILLFQPNNSCDPENKDSGWLWEGGILSNQAMMYRVSTWNNFWSHYDMAEVYSLSSDNWQGNWSVATADFLSARITADRRNSQCDFSSNDDKIKDCYSCSYKRVRVNTGASWGAPIDNVRYCTGDVVGMFEKAASIYIDATHALEFECCQ